MPINIERKELVGTRLSRLSGIPRPLKQLEVNGVSHASKPSIDAIPLTPAKKTAVNSRLKAAKADPEIPTLELVPFGRQPTVDFGHVSIGQTQIKHLTIRNVLDTPQQLFVINFPKVDKGFNIDATEFLLAPKTAIYVVLSWTPTGVGASRETITLQDANRMPRRVVLLGVATRAKPETLKRVPNFPKLCPKRPNLVDKPLTNQNRFPSTAARRLAASESRPLTRLRGSPNKRRQSAQIVRKLLKHDEAMVIKIQSHWRRILVLREFVDLKKRNNAAKCIQKHCREFLKRRENERRRQTAALLIQKRWRGFIRRRNLSRLQDKSAVRIQRYWRNYIVKRDLLRLKNRSAACIQKNWREYVRRRDFLKLRTRAAICLQSHWRDYIIRKKQRELVERSAICIQKYWRQFVERRAQRRLREKSAICIQKNWREYVRKRDLLRLQNRSARCIQKQWRKYVRRRDLLRLQTRSAICIQRCWREFIRRREELRLRQRSAVSIQRHWKGLIKRREYHNLRRTVLFMQLRWRLKRVASATTRLIELHGETRTVLSQWKSNILKIERIQKNLIGLSVASC